MIATGNKRTRAIAAALQLAEDCISGGSVSESDALTAIHAARRFLPAIQSKQAHVNSYRRRVKPDPKYKAWIASLPCSVPNCKLGPIHVCHIGSRSYSQKCSDLLTAPFCLTHHEDDELGMHGRLGKNFWKHYGLDSDELIADLNRRYDARFE